MYLIDFILLLNEDRKSTRLNSSHTIISYAVFCLKKNHTLDHPPLEGEGKTERMDGVSSRPKKARVCPIGPHSDCTSFIFFNDPGAPRTLPFSPPRPPPD